MMPNVIWDNNTFFRISILPFNFTRIFCSFKSDLTDVKISRNYEEELQLQGFVFAIIPNYYIEDFFVFLPILNISNANCQTM